MRNASAKNLKEQKVTGCISPPSQFGPVPNGALLFSSPFFSSSGVEVEEEEEEATPFLQFNNVSSWRTVTVSHSYLRGDKKENYISNKNKNNDDDDNDDDHDHDHDHEEEEDSDDDDADGGGSGDYDGDDDASPKNTNESNISRPSPKNNE
ncbi:hypothetical protein PoB_007540500 [Plakobranchus ocellatus]|uniref:Uncharacterized protein n=1 Tax=Plakobranchus ocellatus TaxID=259542 RepID=A0AAV4DXX7_9GAST|nr:hypothetical protein PoB_007540500 [Plakobranchus ocellatus]